MTCTYTIEKITYKNTRNFKSIISYAIQMVYLIWGHIRISRSTRIAKYDKKKKLTAIN